MSSIKINTNNFELEITHDENITSFQDLLTTPDRNLSFKLSMNGEDYEGTGIRGDDAVWIPFSDKTGLKLFAENPKYISLSESMKTVEKVQEEECFIFPDILEFGLTKDQNEKDFAYILMENVKHTSTSNSRLIGFIPEYDRDYVSKNIHSDLSMASKVSSVFMELDLNPEDEWYKSINCIGGKIVDFHRFELKDERYYFPSNGETKDTLREAYREMVERYKPVLDSGGLPKWKGKIYQGFVFDNGYTMEGYRSSPTQFDSYKKLPFIPLNKSKGKKVLDLGSNQGFFSFQASLHGATEVTGIEMQTEDHLAASDIKRLSGFENVKFINTDAVSYLEESKEHYGLIIMNSVLHQIYKNFEGSDQFMRNISKKCDYFAFETPLHHPLMNISASDVHKNLSKYFKNVRLINVYDAYSSGYRANYVCF
jgi:2-polyprenyl-3-methyl-5-hydroxy-6-metoxy-1,4-benzoquinol methylase